MTTTYTDDFDGAEIISWFFDSKGDISDPESDVTVGFKLRRNGLVFMGRYNGFGISLGGRRINKLDGDFKPLEDKILQAMVTMEMSSWAKPWSYI